MRAAVLPLVCERVRGQVSALLDGELSQLERRMVAAHLERCVECRAFEETVRTFTDELRAAAFESPRTPVVVRRSRRVSLAAVQVGVAATVAVATLGVVGQLGLPRPHESPDVRGQVAAADLFKTSWQPERELAQIDAGLSAPEDEKPGRLPAV